MTASSYTVTLTYFGRHKTGCLAGIRTKRTVSMVDAQHCAWFMDRLLSQKREDIRFSQHFTITPL